MATNPTPEETALKILDIFVHHFKFRPGNVLDRRNFFSRIEAADFAPGIDFAAQQGWIEILREGASFRLTAAGFAKVATIPTPEETALKILDIFVKNFKCGPGNVLQRQNFDTPWHKRGLAAEDFAPGMKFAARQGWVEVIREGASFMLTEVGFAKA